MSALSLPPGPGPGSDVGTKGSADLAAENARLRQQADDWARAHRWYELKAELEAVTKERDELLAAAPHIRRAVLLEAADDVIGFVIGEEVADAAVDAIVRWLRERAERETIE